MTTMIKDIIIEGLDRTGKTTQIQNLWTYLNSIYPDGCNIVRGDKMNKLVPTEHHQYLYANSINMAFRNMIQSRKYNLQGIRIYDRLHLSEIVYGAKYRKYPVDRIYNIEKQVADFDDIYEIILIDEIENLVDRDDNDGFTSDPVEMENEKQEFVDAFFDSTIANKLIININGKSIDEVFHEILDFIEE
jgi:thymidylate kinase